MTRLNSPLPARQTFNSCGYFEAVISIKYKNPKEMSDFIKKKKKSNEASEKRKEQVKKGRIVGSAVMNNTGEISRSEYKSPIFPGGFIFLNLTLPERVS